MAGQVLAWARIARGVNRANQVLEDRTSSFFQPQASGLLGEPMADHASIQSPCAFLMPSAHWGSFAHWWAQACSKVGTSDHDEVDRSVVRRARNAW